MITEHKGLLKRFKKFWPECNEFGLYMRCDVSFSHITGEELHTYRGNIELSCVERFGKTTTLRLESLTGKTFATPDEKIANTYKETSHGQTIYIDKVGFFCLTEEKVRL